MSSNVALTDVSALEEARLARTRAVWSDAGAWGRLWVRGRDRVEFLHGQSSNDVKALAPGQGHATTFLTGKGKMRGDGWIYALEERLLVVTDPGVGPGVRAHLETFIISEDVTVEDFAPATVARLVHGPGARAAAAALLPGVAFADGAEHQAAGSEIDGVRVLAASGRWTGEEGVLIVAGSTVAPRLAARLESALPRVGEAALECLRIEAGRPLFGADLDADTIPIEAGLGGRLSYTKGCYTGNEVMARIKTYGHVNRHLSGLRLEGAEVPVHGAAIEHEGRAAGRVGSACFSAALGAPIALALIRREAAGAGTRVRIAHAGGWLEAEVVETPFLRRE